jgi:hypothetical protein
MKNIIPKIEFLPNYLWHIFAICDLWNKPTLTYKLENQNYISQDDRLYLNKNRERIAWGNGRCGDMMGLLFAIPLGLREISFEDYLEYLELLIKASIENDWVYFVEKYDIVYDMSNVQLPESYIKFLKRYKTIISNNYKCYLNKKWQTHQVKLHTTAEYIDHYFGKLNVINSWEDFLGLTLPLENFEIILTIANENLPSANDLSRHRYNFYYEPNNLEHLVTFILHEIGTNLLSEFLHKNYNDPDLQTEFIQQNNLCWQAFESLAEFTKAQLFNMKAEIWNEEIYGGGKYRFPVFYDFYSKIDFKNNKLPYDKLMKNAILHVVDSLK